MVFARRLGAVLVAMMLAAGLASCGTSEAPSEPSATAVDTGQPLSGEATLRDFAISREGASLDLGYCGNGTIDQAHPQVTTVLFAIHGTDRNACDYAGYAMSSAGVAGASKSTLVVAPFFASEADLDSDDNHTLYWEDSSDGWKSGDDSLTSPLDRPWTISSYAALDTLVSELGATDLYPNLKSVVFAGHSAGGQFVNRYSFGSPRPDLVADVRVRYVVMNPSSYLYLTPSRFVDGHFRSLTPNEVGACPAYDDYKYGMQQRYGYMAALSEEQLVRQFVQRNVTYLLGESDTDPNDSSLDTTCQAEWQGSQRFERGQRYWDSLLRVVGPAIQGTQELVTVPNVDHDAEGMFTSDEGAKAIFDR